MRYQCGSEVSLGDIVSVPVPQGYATARVVMLGDTGEHLEIDPDFIRWVLAEGILANKSIFVEWIGVNPFAHSDPGHASAGSYMSTVVDVHVHLAARATG